jgi:mannosylglucosylglycerate synthase
MMARVTLLHYASPPVVGGVESILARQAELLARAGHQVSVLTGRGSTWDRHIRVQVVPEFDSRHPRVLELKHELDQGCVPADFQPFMEECLHVLLQELGEAGWLIAHNVASQHKNLALTAALRRYLDEPGRAEVVLWHHDFAWNSRRYAGELHPGYPWDLLRSAWPGVRQVTIWDSRQAEMSQLYRIPPGQIKVIPNGIDPAEFHHLGAETRKIIDRLDLNTANPLLLTPVRLTRRKNLELGLYILADLVQRMPEAAWVITGPLGAHNPDNQAYFQQLVALRAKLGLEKQAILLAESHPDGLTDAQIADFYRLADALLIPSQEEGFGLPVIEGGLARLIIFASDLPSLRALGGEWINYFQLSDDPAEIARRIEERLKNDPVYRLREHIRAHFTWEAIYEKQIAPLLNGQPHAEVGR